MQNGADYSIFSIFPADHALLASVRSPAERVVSAPFWLRTCYRDRDGHSTDAAHEALIECTEEFREPGTHGGTHVFNDAMLYDYGPYAWQQIFTRIPELLSQKGCRADYYEQRKAEAIQEAIEADEEENAELEEQGYTKSEDGLDWSEMFQGVHYASVVGEIWVADEEALQSKKLLLAWVDDCGRVIRWTRLPVTEFDLMLGLIFMARYDEREAWRTLRSVLSMTGVASVGRLMGTKPLKRGSRGWDSAMKLPWFNQSCL